MHFLTSVLSCQRFAILAVTAIVFLFVRVMRCSNDDDDDDGFLNDGHLLFAGFALKDESISDDLLSDLRHAMEPPVAMEQDAPASKPTGVNPLILEQLKLANHNLNELREICPTYRVKC